MRLTAAALLSPALSLAPPAFAVTADSSPQLEAMVAGAVGRHIVQRFADLAAATQQLDVAVESWCRTNEAQVPAGVRDAFKDAALAWARVGYFRFGPANKDDRLQRIAFSPDPRGLVRRQVSTAISHRDRALLSKEAIATQSVAIQGLPALELLFYPTSDDGAAAEGSYRCELASAIAGNVAQLTSAMNADWTAPDGWRALLMAPGPENAVYKSHAEAAAELFRALLTGLQIITDREVVPWLKAAGGARAWAGLPYERSGLSRDYLQAGLESVHGLHTALDIDGIAASLAAKQPDKKWIGDWLRNAYAILERDVPTFVLPSKISATPSFDLDALRRASFYGNGLRQVVGREIAPAAGLLLGFNELDGD